MTKENKNIDRVIGILQNHHLRVTQSRMAVASTLMRYQDSTLSAEDIYISINRSQEYECDQVSVYRSLAKFEELGVAIKTQFQGQAARYKFNHSFVKEASGHKHYFKCDGCNVLESLESCLIAQKENELKNEGYKNLKHHIEITGLCPSCAQ